MEKKARRNRHWWVLGSVTAALVVYPLSAGLLTYCFARGWVSETVYLGLCDTLYVPLAWHNRIEGPGSDLIGEFLHWCYRIGN